MPIDHEKKIFDAFTHNSTLSMSILKNIEFKNAIHLLEEYENKNQEFEIIRKLIEYCHFGATSSVFGPILIPFEDQTMSLWLRRFGFWEPHESWILSQIVKDKRILNFGSSIGWYLLLSSKFNAKSVIGYDANPIACAVSEFNCLINDFDNVQIENLAINSINSKIKLEIQQGNFGNTIIVPDKNGKVESKTIHEIFQNLGQNFDVIISDLQGFDYLILESFYECNNPDKLLMFEFEKEYKQKIILRREKGFSAFQLIDGKLHCVDEDLNAVDSTVFIACGEFTQKLQKIIEIYPDLIPKIFDLNQITNQYEYHPNIRN